MKFVQDGGEVDIFITKPGYKTAQGLMSILDESVLHNLHSVPAFSVDVWVLDLIDFHAGRWG